MNMTDSSNHGKEPSDDADSLTPTTSKRTRHGTGTEDSGDDVGSAKTPVERALEQLDEVNKRIASYDPALKEHAAKLLVSMISAPTPKDTRSAMFNPQPQSPAGSAPRSLPWFKSFAELVEYWRPATQAEWALLSAFYRTQMEGEEFLSAQALNTILKHHGNGISNITRALDDLVNASPALLMQVKKAGTTRQARKSYRITTQGTNFVEARLRGVPVPPE